MGKYGQPLHEVVAYIGDELMYLCPACAGYPEDTDEDFEPVFRETLEGDEQCEECGEEIE